MERFKRIATAIIILPFTLIPLAFLIGGVQQIWLQDHRMGTFKPVEATVQSVRLQEKHRTSKGRHYTEYSPSVRYSYGVNGRQYTSTGVFPLGADSGTREWAGGIIDRFKLGTTCTAWFDPANHSDAFIVRRYKFTPPAIVLFSMLFVCIFTIGLGWGVLSDLGSRAPIDLHDGRFELRPKGTLERELRMCALISAVWYLAAMLAVGDFCLRAGDLPPLAGCVGVAIYLVIGLLPLRLAIKDFRISRHMRTPHVCIDTAAPRIGDSFTALVAQEFLDGCERQVTVGLLCQRTTGSGKSSRTMIIYQHDELAEGLSGRSLGLAAQSFSIRIPTTISPRDFSRFSRPDDWFIRVTSQFEDRLKYDVMFPVTVEPDAIATA